jgi:alpha-1,6-mannosyltransferase
LKAADAISPRRMVVALTVPVAVSGAAIYPRYGTDLWEYVVYERLWRVYGENPLLAVPALHPEDWAYRFAWHVDRGAAYGPLWVLGTWPINAAGGDSITGLTVAYKLLAAVGYLVCAALIYRAARAEFRARALILFAWNPVVLFDVLGKAHNDVLVAALMLAAVLLVDRMPAGSVVVAAAAVLVKLSIGGVAPALLKRLATQGRWSALGLGMGVSALLAAAAYSPFWGGTRILGPLLSQVSQVEWSIGVLLLLLSEALTGMRQEALVRGLLVGAWLASVLLLLWRLPVRTKQELATQSALLVLGTAALLTTAFYAHYLVPVIALAALSDHPRLHAAVYWLSLGSLGAYAVPVLGLAFGSQWGGTGVYYLAGTALTFGPLLVALTGETVRAQRRTPALEARAA